MSSPSAVPGQRSTRQRAAVAELLDRVDGFRSAQELHDLLRAGGDAIGLTTVYRNLQALADVGTVDALRTDSGEVLYRRCPTASHHHHLVCRSCGTSIDVAGPEVETWAARTAAEHGFSDLSHTLEIFGTCPACRTPA